MQKSTSYYSEKLRFLIFKQYKEKTEGFIDFKAIDSQEHAKQMEEYYKDKQVPFATLGRFVGTRQDGVKITVKVLDKLTQLLEKYAQEENAWQKFIQDYQTRNYSAVLDFAPVPYHAYFLKKHFPEWYFQAHQQIEVDLGLSPSLGIDYKNEILETYNTFQGATFEQKVQMANNQTIRIFDYFFYYDHVSKLVSALKRGQKVELLLCNPFSELAKNRQIDTKKRVISSLERIIKMTDIEHLDNLEIKLFNQSPSYFLYQVGEYMHMGFSYIYLGTYESAFNFCFDAKQGSEIYNNTIEHSKAFWEHDTTIVFTKQDLKDIKEGKKILKELIDEKIKSIDKNIIPKIN